MGRVKSGRSHPLIQRQNIRGVRLNLENVKDSVDMQNLIMEHRDNLTGVNMEIEALKEMLGKRNVKFMSNPYIGFPKIRLKDRHSKKLRRLERRKNFRRRKLPSKKIKNPINNSESR